MYKLITHLSGSVLPSVSVLNEPVVASNYCSAGIIITGLRDTRFPKPFFFNSLCDGINHSVQQFQCISVLSVERICLLTEQLY